MTEGTRNAVEGTIVRGCGTALWPMLRSNDIQCRSGDIGICYRQRSMQGLDHYLDDFMMVGKPRSPQCKRNLETALVTCKEVGFRVVPKETEGPTTALSLLGVENCRTQNTELLQLQKKLSKLRELVERWRRRKSCSKWELQLLAGYLNHACKVIGPDHCFLQGVFGLLLRFESKDHPIHHLGRIWNGGMYLPRSGMVSRC